MLAIASIAISLCCVYVLCTQHARISELELDNRLQEESIKALHQRIYHLSRKPE